MDAVSSEATDRTTDSAAFSAGSEAGVDPGVDVRATKVEVKNSCSFHFPGIAFQRLNRRRPMELRPGLSRIWADDFLPTWATIDPANQAHRRLATMLWARVSRFRCGP